MVEETVLGHEEGVGLKGALQAAKGFHPLGGGGGVTTAAIVAATPAGEFDEMAGLHNVGDVALGIGLLAQLQDGHFVAQRAGWAGTGGQPATFRLPLAARRHEPMEIRRRLANFIG
jgi:hypothetical protein